MLLVVSEQGLGDTVMCLRHIRILRQRGLSFCMAIQDCLVEVAKKSFPDISIYPVSSINEWTMGPWTPIMSLSRVLKTDLYIDRANVMPYLSTNTYSDKENQSRSEKLSEFLIGLCWQGNPETEQGNLVGRSCGLSTFAQLAEIGNIRFISLQKEHGREELSECSFRHLFINAEEAGFRIDSIEETATTIKSCNLVITVDTMIAHLSGALGQQTWTLLKKVPDWRWGLEGSKTSLYPTMKLYRQRDFGVWSDVINILASDLKQLVS